MKSLFSVTFLFLSLNARADGSRNPLDELNSAIVDSVKESYQLPFNKGDAKFLPDAIVCNDKGDIKVTLSGVTQAKALLEGGLNDGSTFMTTDNWQSGLLIDWSDGDKVGGLFVLMKDLKSLAKKEVSSIPAKVYRGSWGIDGDRYPFRDVNCKLKEF